MIDPSIISTRLSDRLIFSRDASLYRLVPSGIARPRHIEDVRSIIEYCSKTNQSLTFRAGGTSLSGQSVTNGIIVDLSRHWDQFEVIDDGRMVRLGPGITGGRVNGLLRRYGRKLGPDPASIIAAMIGGIVGNNASGMCCGTALNTYHTMHSMEYMLYDGTRINTSEDVSNSFLKTSLPDVYNGILSLRDRIHNDSELISLIRRKYLIKNTVGYSLNAFIDEQDPAQIIAKLLVGSEGTLGFIESITYNTIVEANRKYTQLFVYDSIQTACRHVSFWRDAGAAAVELMDDASLHSFADLPTTPHEYRFNESGIAALLVEFHDTTPPDVIPDSLNNISIWTRWATDPNRQSILWRLRKGLMPTIGAMRPSGATMINEDVAVPPEHLAGLVFDLKMLFQRHGFHRAIIFGHAKDGNMHFVLNHDFGSEAEILRYARFMDDIAAIVVDKYQGSLKAEHGTGRNVAPFVEREWGSIAYGIMKQVKALLDPLEVFNRGVLLNEDQTIHLKNIKQFPTVEPEIDKCIECGFCEHVCPTRLTTTTPRQRIVLRREIEYSRNNKEAELISELESTEKSESIDSCAVDSMCSVVCPVGIDTGLFVRRERGRRNRKILSAMADLAAKSYRYISPQIKRFISLRYNIDQFASSPHVPAVHTETMGDKSKTGGDKIIMSYLQGCPSRWYASDDTSVKQLAELAGIVLQPLNPMSAYCCSQPFESKGYIDAARGLAERTLSEGNGVLFTDTSTCASALVKAAENDNVKIVTPVAWIRDYILPNVTTKKVYDVLAVHPGCGIHKSNEVNDLIKICSNIAYNVVVPPSAYCCGMAGIHGLEHDEIPATVIAQEKSDLDNVGPIDAFVSLNTMCQMALSQYTGIECKSLFEVMLEAMSE